MPKSSRSRRRDAKPRYAIAVTLETRISCRSTDGNPATLAAFFGTDEITFSVNSVVTGTTHTFQSFDDVVTEVDHARIHGGMHYRHSVKEGNRLGRKVAEHILKHHFRTLDHD